MNLDKNSAALYSKHRILLRKKIKIVGFVDKKSAYNLRVGFL
jgi:hypothetical protein